MKTTIEFKHKDYKAFGVTVKSRTLTEAELVPVVRDVLDRLLQNDALKDCEIEVTLDA